ncbi:MAG: lipopolysaccharide heptosyltransferase II [Candidatus Eisenbacteria bacterium]|nr:lipopolysaccharide heptosyltransferase II [Candidatus Eisenbacteria bacterium]
MTRVTPMRAAGSRPRVLVRLPNWIGDAIMAAPALQILAASRAIDLHLVGLAATLDLFSGFDEPFHLARPLTRSGGKVRGLITSACELRPLGFDAALVLPPSFSAALHAWVVGAPRRVGWATEARRALLTHAPEQPARSVHLREQYGALAGALAEQLVGSTLAAASGPRLPLRAEELVAADRTWTELGFVPGGTIAVAPGATYGATKRWPEERFVDLARGLQQDGWDLLWIGGAEERPLCDRLVAATAPNGPGRSVSRAGRDGLRATLALLSSVRAAISNDSGAMHLAQAAGAPVVGIYGSTAPEWTGPVGDEAEVVRHPVHCSPCFARTCPTAIECLTGIQTSEVRAAVDRLCARPRPKGRPALFVDRDGTLLEFVDYLARPEEVQLAPGAAAALRRIRAGGFAIVVVTNQSLIARGRLDRAGLAAVHRRMEALLAEEGVELDGIEICPHHPDFGGPCACRKPEPGLLRRAAHRHALDLSRSVMLGDSWSDLEAGANAGARPVLIASGYGPESAARLAAAGGRVRDVEAWTVSDWSELAQRLMG